MKHVVSGLQRMIECHEMHCKSTIAWDCTHELLQIAHDATEEEETRGGRRVRG